MQWPVILMKVLDIGTNNLKAVSQNLYYVVAIVQRLLLFLANDFIVWCPSITEYWFNYL